MRGKSWVLTLVLGLAGVLVGVQLSFGAGFALYEGSARGNALGGAMVGRADDPSALFYNPAGITQLPGFQVMAGATLVAPETDVVTNIGTPVQTTTSMEDNLFLVPHFYASYQFSDRVWFGLGSFSRFGLGTEFDPAWPGRFNNIETNVQSLSVNPNIAVKLTDTVSAAAGIEVMWFDVDIRRLLPIAGIQDAKFEGDSFGYGFNLALHYKPCQWFAAGILYRSEVKQNLDGDGTFTPTTILNSDIKASIKLPDSFAGGVMVKPMDRLSLEAGFVWTRWRNFEALTINTNTIGALSSDKNWDNSWRLNFGVEYELLDWLDLRAGYTFDENVIPDETVDYLLPANNRHYFSFGPGFHFGPWSFDLSYMFLHQEDRDVNNSTAFGVGTGVVTAPARFEEGIAHKFGMSVGYKF